MIKDEVKFLQKSLFLVDLLFTSPLFFLDFFEKKRKQYVLFLRKNDAYKKHFVSLQNAENAISRPLKFKISLESMPPDPPRWRTLAFDNFKYMQQLAICFLYLSCSMCNVSII